MILPAAVLTVGVLATAYVLTRSVRRYSLRTGMLDVPNERSSHVDPTPRGGGLAIALAILCGLLAATAFGIITHSLVAALGGGALVGATGWIDDRRRVAPHIRLVVQLVAALWALAWLDGLPALRIGVHAIDLGPAGWILGALGVVWMTNLFNFMDGIDGIAAGEALCVGAAGALLGAAAGAPEIAIAAAIVAAGSAGFLPWNWQPARIFMGDVGSGFLGYCLAVLAIASENRDGPALVLWIMLLGVFVFDSTATLIRRAARGEPVYTAHRSHAYQRASRAWSSHRRVAGTVVVANLLLAALAFLAFFHPALTPAVLAAAFASVTAIYVAIERKLPM